MRKHLSSSFFFGIIFSSVYFSSGYFSSVYCDVPTYFFHQECNDMSMVAPMLNLSLVEKFERAGYDEEMFRSYTQKEWFVLNQKPLVTWQESFAQLNCAGALSKYPSLIAYCNETIERSPVMPHIYDEHGRLAFFDPSDSYDVPILPHSFVDCSALHGNVPCHERFSFGFKVPFVKENGNYKVYYVQNKKVGSLVFDKSIRRDLEQFESITKEIGVQTSFNQWGEVHKKSYARVMKILDSKLGYLKLKKLHVIKPGVISTAGYASAYKSLFLSQTKDNAYNFEAVATAGYLARGYMHDGRAYVPSAHGLYKMMLLLLRLSGRNELVRRGDDEWGVVNDFLSLVRGYGDKHPWNRSRFNRGNFLQYEIAQVLKEDRELCENLALSIDFYSTAWRFFVDLKEHKKYFYKKNGGLVPYDKKTIERFFPGDEQVLAMMVMQAVRYLWYGACSESGLVFGKAVEQELFIDNMSFAEFKDGAMRSKIVFEKIETKSMWDYFSLAYWYNRWLPNPSRRPSFLETWKKIKTALVTRWEKNSVVRKHWISFDGHGWVVSFDKHLIDVQKKIAGVDTKLLDDLGIVGIDSRFGDDLHVFYKKT